MKTFTVLVLCIFALCCCEETETERNAGPRGGRRDGQCRGIGPSWKNDIEAVCKEQPPGNWTTISNALMTGKCHSDLSVNDKWCIKRILIHKQKMNEDGIPNLQGLKDNFTSAAEKIGECQQIKVGASDAGICEFLTCLGEARRMAKVF